MKLLVLFIIFSITLWYFNIDVHGFVDSHPQIKVSFEAVTNFLVALWHNYLSSVASYVWNDIIIDIIWKHLAPILAPLFAKLKG